MRAQYSETIPDQRLLKLEVSLADDRKILDILIPVHVTGFAPYAATL